jgi:hypothetical protein
VIPAQGSVFVVADVQGFKSRPASPRGGEGLFVLPLEQGAALPSAPTPLTVTNARGETVSSASVQRAQAMG